MNAILSGWTSSSLVDLDVVVLAKNASKGIVLHTDGSSRYSAEIFLVAFKGYSCIALNKTDSEVG